jgi:hypothetical protein
MDMKMLTTFTAWHDYHVKVLFPWWNVTSKTGYAVTCIIIFLAAIFYQACRSVVCGIEFKMSKPSCSRAHLVWVGSMCDIFPDSNVLLLRILHAIAHAFTYAMGLLLMLVAMTFNPGLFVVLICGYWVGDLLFEVLDDDMD